MSPSINISAISLLVVIALLVACVVVLVRGLRLPRHLPRRAACGNCAYETAFISETCQECGADLREVGTLTARTALRLRSSPLLMLMAWTIIMAFASAISLTLFSEFARQPVGISTNTSFDRTFTPDRHRTRSRDEESLSQYEIHFQGKTTDDYWTSATVQMIPQVGPRVAIDVNMNDREWVMRSVDDVVEGKGFDVEAVNKFFDAASIDRTSEEVQREISQFAVILDLLADVGLQAAEQKQWGLPARYADMFSRSKPPEAPILDLLNRRGSSGSNGASRVTYRSSAPGANRGFEVNVDAQYTIDEERRPLALESLSVKIPAEVGWPIVFLIDHSADTWQVVRGEEELANGTMPVTEDDIAAAFSDITSDTYLQMLKIMEPDFAKLINLSNDDLIGFTGWTARPTMPRQRESLGLHAGGGRTSSSSNSNIRPMPWQIYAIVSGLVLTWIIGGFLILGRRRKLLAS